MGILDTILDGQKSHEARRRSYAEDIYIGKTRGTLRGTVTGPLRKTTVTRPFSAGVPRTSDNRLQTLQKVNSPLARNNQSNHNTSKPRIHNNIQQVPSDELSDQTRGVAGVNRFSLEIENPPSIENLPQSVTREMETKNRRKMRNIRRMKACSWYLLWLAILSLLLGIIDIELQFAESNDIIIENTTCDGSIIQKEPLIHTGPIWGESISLAVITNRSGLFVCSFFTVGLLFWYRKLKYNLEEIKEGRMDELGWPPLFSFSTECILFWFQVFICGAHIPPWASGWPPEFQLFVFARIIQMVKFLRHNHPMKFGNLIDMLSHISPIELDDSDFLLKTYFVKYPLTVLFCGYIYVVFLVGYMVFVLERGYGEYKHYLDCVWMISVTLPNLGFGDFTPQFWLSRLIVAMLGVIGVLQTALIVNAITKYLSLTHEENKIMHFVDRHNINGQFENAAANLIQVRWRQYVYEKSLKDPFSHLKQGCCNDIERFNTRRHLRFSFKRAYRSWRRVKEAKRICDHVFASEFLTDSPEIVRQYILSHLEKIIEHLGIDQTNNQMVNLNTIYTDRTMSLNVPQLNVPNSSFRSGVAGPLANCRSDQIKSSMGTQQQAAGPYAALPNHTPPTATVNNHHSHQQQPTSTVATLGAPSNVLPTIHSMGSFISGLGNSGSPGTESNGNDLAFLIQRIQNDLSKLQSAINQRDNSSSTDLSDIRVDVLPKNSTPL